MRRAALALLCVLGCNRGLDSYEPFACANDGTCPAAYGCTAEKKCVGLSKRPIIPCVADGGTCPSLMACDTLAGQCAPDCSGKCSSDTSCALPGVCRTGKPVGASCSVEADCASRRCVGPAGAAVCVDTCSAANPTCSATNAKCLTSAGYCVRTCTAERTCPEGGACANGLCVPGRPIGAACAAASDCAGGNCRTDGFPGGACVVENCSSTNPCPLGSTCAGLCQTPDCLQLSAVCLPGCSTSASCRPGYGCLDTFGDSVCRPVGLGMEGQSCATGADCANGFCISSPGGALCRTPCSDDATCGTGKVCSFTILHSNYEVCGPACITPAMCGGSDTCACFGSTVAGGTAKRGCQPKCTQNANCYDGSICDTATGLCGRKPCQNAASCGAGSYCTWNQTFDSNCSTADSGYTSSCRVNFTGQPAGSGTRCVGGLYCNDSICAGANHLSRGMCTVACPDDTGCPSGTTCAAVDRPSNALDGTGKLLSIKLCIQTREANINGPCSTDVQCPVKQQCVRGFCNGRGQLGTPCPARDYFLECSLLTTSWCIWDNNNMNLTTCSTTCMTNPDCQGIGFPGGCCRGIQDGGTRVCVTAPMCDGGI